MLFLTLHKPGIINAQVSFPTIWDELTTEELLVVCRLQLSQHATPEAGRAAVFLELLKLRCKYHTGLPQNFTELINLNDLAETGYQLVEFLYAENNRTIQPHPEIQLPGSKIKLAGPAEAFNSVTCGEFEDTEIFFNQFMENPSHEALASIAAILYRPAGTPYIHLDANKVAVRYDYKKTLENLKTFAPYFLYSIFCWYVGCRAQLPQLFPVVYKGDGSEPESSETILAFTKCIHAGAGPKNGSRTDIRLMRMKEFFFDMEQEAIHAQKTKELYEQR